MRASHPELGDYCLECEAPAELLFTENETNAARLWGQSNPTPYVKDAFHRVRCRRQARSRQSCEERNQGGSALRFGCSCGGQPSCTFTPEQASRSANAFAAFDQIFASRLADANEFYERITASGT